MFPLPYRMSIDVWIVSFTEQSILYRGDRMIRVSWYAYHHMKRLLCDYNELQIEISFLHYSNKILYRLYRARLFSFTPKDTPIRYVYRLPVSSCEPGLSPLHWIINFFSWDYWSSETSGGPVNPASVSVKMVKIPFPVHPSNPCPRNYRGALFGKTNLSNFFESNGYFFFTNTFSVHQRKHFRGNFLFVFENEWSTIVEPSTSGLGGGRMVNFLNFILSTVQKVKTSLARPKNPRKK